jgi:hypothetical protein
MRVLPNSFLWKFKFVLMLPQSIYWKFRGQGFYVLSRREFEEYGWSLASKSVNWGDLLLREIADQFLDISAIRREYSGAVFGGSVLSEDHFNRFQRNSSSKLVLAVCCGARNSIDRLKPPSNLDIHGVRGYDSASLIENSVPAGDPGMLAPLVFEIEPKIENGFRKLLVPHFSQNVAKPLSDHSFLSTMLPFGRSSKNLVHRINESNFVLAGSLHAGICAFATGTPFAFSLDGSTEDPFKFYDFARFVGIKIGFYEDFESAMRWYVREQSMSFPRSSKDFEIYPRSLSRFFKIDISELRRITEVHTESRNVIHGLKVETLRDYLK